MTPTETADGDCAVAEIRVHGIGHHGAWSALGSPRKRSKATDLVDVYDPPNADASVRLVNWSRTSRQLTGFIWFLALPFTLVNVAGHMGPPLERGGRARVLSVCTHLAGALVSVSVCVWLIVLAETALKQLGAIDAEVFSIFALLLAAAGVTRRLSKRGRLRSALAFAGMSAAAIVTLALVWDGARSQSLQAPVGSPGLFEWIAGLIGAALAALVIGRHWLRTESRTARPIAALHAVAFLAIGIAVAVWRPSRDRAERWMPDWMTVRIAGERFVDAVTLTAVATTGLAVLAAVALLAAHYTASSERRGPNLPGAALLLCLAVLLTHAILSIARVALDWLGTYAVWLSAIVSPAGAQTPADWRALMPYMDRAVGVHRIDLVVVAALAFFLALIAGFLVTFWQRPSQPSQAGADAATSHKIVQSMPFTLAPAMCLTLALFVATLVGLGAFAGLAADGGIPAITRLIVVVIVQLAALLIVLLISNRLQKVRDSLERFADVAGFWSVDYHPLAGKSYRPDVLKGICQAIAETEARQIVIVGHSQGSVLSAAVVGRLFEADEACLTGRKLQLVTCGSPLASLYAAFFPATFDDRRFAAVSAGGEWTNLWRSTDAIASEIPCAKNQHLPDPRQKDGKALGHGDYWTDPDLMGVVVRYAGREASATRGR